VKSYGLIRPARFIICHNHREWNSDWRELRLYLDEQYRCNVVNVDELPLRIRSMVSEAGCVPIYDPRTLCLVDRIQQRFSAVNIKQMLKEYFHSHLKYMSQNSDANRLLIRDTSNYPDVPVLPDNFVRQLPLPLDDRIHYDGIWYESLRGVSRGKFCGFCGLVERPHDRDSGSSSDTVDSLMCCSKCGLYMHTRCAHSHHYRPSTPSEDWLCSRCVLTSTPSCVFCEENDPCMALAITGGGFWAHGPCGWTANTEIYGQQCTVCNNFLSGCLVKCASPGCGSVFHMSCAWLQGFPLTRSCVGDPHDKQPLSIIAYCGQHTAVNPPRRSPIRLRFKLKNKDPVDILSNMAAVNFKALHKKMFLLNDITLDKTLSEKKLDQLGIDIKSRLQHESSCVMALLPDDTTSCTLREYLKSSAVGCVTETWKNVVLVSRDNRRLYNGLQRAILEHAGHSTSHLKSGEFFLIGFKDGIKVPDQPQPATMNAISTGKPDSLVSTVSDSSVSHSSIAKLSKPLDNVSEASMRRLETTKGTAAGTQNSTHGVEERVASISATAPRPGVVSAAPVVRKSIPRDIIPVKNGSSDIRPVPEPSFKQRPLYSQASVKPRSTNYLSKDSMKDVHAARENRVLKFAKPNGKSISRQPLSGSGRAMSRNDQGDDISKSVLADEPSTVNIKNIGITEKLIDSSSSAPSPTTSATIGSSDASEGLHRERSPVAFISRTPCINEDVPMELEDDDSLRASCRIHNSDEGSNSKVSSDVGGRASTTNFSTTSSETRKRKVQWDVDDSPSWEEGEVDSGSSNTDVNMYGSNFGLASRGDETSADNRDHWKGNRYMSRYRDIDLSGDRPTNTNYDGLNQKEPRGFSGFTHEYSPEDRQSPRYDDNRSRLQGQRSRGRTESPMRDMESKPFGRAKVIDLAMDNEDYESSSSEEKLVGTAKKTRNRGKIRKAMRANGYVFKSKSAKQEIRTKRFFSSLSASREN